MTDAQIEEDQSLNHWFESLVHQMPSMSRREAAETILLLGAINAELEGVTVEQYRRQSHQILAPELTFDEFVRQYINGEEAV